MDPDGPATWLVTLGLNPAAISRLCYSRQAQRLYHGCAIVVGPNGTVKHRWLAGGGPPAPVRDISTVGYPAFWAGPIGIGGRGLERR